MSKVTRWTFTAILAVKGVAGNVNLLLNRAGDVGRVDTDEAVASCLGLQNWCPLGFVSKRQDSMRGTSRNGKVSSWEYLEKSQPRQVCRTHLGYILRELAAVILRLLSWSSRGCGGQWLGQPHCSPTEKSWSRYSSKLFLGTWRKRCLEIAKVTILATWLPLVVKLLDL